MNISSKGPKAKTVTKLNIWGGAANNENYRATKGIMGKVLDPNRYGGDLTNEQPRTTKGFNRMNPGSVQFKWGGDGGVNENPKGWKQGATPKASRNRGI